MSPRFLHTMAAVVALASLAEANAQIMLSPTEVLGTDLGVFNDTVPLTHMIDHSGLEHPFESGVTSFDTYFATPRLVFATNAPANNWQSNFSFDLPIHGYVDFDFGASIGISRLAIWNVSLKDVTVKLADDPLALPNGTVLGQFVLTDHTSFPFSYPVDVLSFPQPHQGRYLRLEISSTYPIAPGLNFGYAIVGEVVASAAVSPPPGLNIQKNQDGSVTVTFSGQLQSADALSQTFSDVPGNPSGTHTIPAAALLPLQFFQVR